MSEETLIRILSTGKIFLYKSDDKKSAQKYQENDKVLVDTDGILEEGIVVVKNSEITEIETGVGQVIRVLNKEDMERHTQLKVLAREYLEEAQKKVTRHSLAMKILDADFSFDQKKLTFYFSANGRVDFRGLVLDMAKSFEKLIRLQQVGAREEARYFGGIGKCGRELCCRKLGNCNQAVTLEMIQAQDLSTSGSGKLAGCCGKLMCCLAYEAEDYPKKEMLKKTKEAKK